MSIANRLVILKNNITSAYNAASDKFAVIPNHRNTRNMAAMIESIPAGISRVVNGGTYAAPAHIRFKLPDNVTQIGDHALSSAFISDAVLPNRIDSVDFNMVQNIASSGADHAFSAETFGNSSLSSVTAQNLQSVGDSGLAHAFESSYLRSIVFPALTTAATLTFEHAFDGSELLESASFSALEDISNSGTAYRTFSNAFFGCTALTTVEFPALVSTGQASFYYAFQDCSSLQNVGFDSLADFSGAETFSHAFRNCTALTGVSFPLMPARASIGTYHFWGAFFGCTNFVNFDFDKIGTLGDHALYQAFSSTAVSNVAFTSLEAISAGGLNGAFTNCPSLTSVSFPALTTSSFGSYTDQFNNMLQGVTGCTVHFPAAIQSIIGSWADVTAGFGGTNTTVLFDL